MATTKKKTSGGATTSAKKTTANPDETKVAVAASSVAAPSAAAPSAAAPSAAAPSAAKPTVSSSSPDFEPQAHPDAKLSKKQTKQLFDLLVSERERVLKGLGEHLGDAISNIDPLSDEMDIAQRHSEQAYLMRFADKERKLLGEIANALEKMETGEYGLCEGTGEPIAPRRLELRPWTRYSVEYKEQMEREKKQHSR